MAPVDELIVNPAGVDENVPTLNAPVPVNVTGWGVVILLQKGLSS
jgi:hypothetical protein